MRKYNSISYIVPVYKTPLTLLERCLDSIEAAIQPNSECIVAFDGKYRLPKNKEFKPRDERFRFITFDHAGTFECRKNAIEESTKDIIVNVDSDDTISIYTENIILDQMSKHNYDMSFIPTIEIPSGIVRRVPPTKRKYLKTFFSGNMDWRNSLCNFSIVTSELGKKLVEDTPYIPNYIMTEDQAMAHFYLNNCKKFGLIDSDPLYMHYYGTGISTMYDKPRSFIRDQVNITVNFLKNFYTDDQLRGYIVNERKMVLRYTDDSKLKDNSNGN